LWISTSAEVGTAAVLPSIAKQEMVGHQCSCLVVNR
jgi:hypothetical protein